MELLWCRFLQMKLYFHLYSFTISTIKANNNEMESGVMFWCLLMLHKQWNSIKMYAKHCRNHWNEIYEWNFHKMLYLFPVKWFFFLGMFFEHVGRLPILLYFVIIYLLLFLTFFFFSFTKNESTFEAEKTDISSKVSLVILCFISSSWKFMKILKLKWSIRKKISVELQSFHSWFNSVFF